MRRTWGFQGFEEELAALPDKQGVLWFAEVDGNIVRVGALSPLEDGIGEMKRLFVRPEAETVVEGARRRCYKTLRRDTLSTMETAMALYRKIGLIEIAAYAVNPVEGAMFLELKL